jgi:very-short-patch-repair endonuclease
VREKPVKVKLPLPPEFLARVRALRRQATDAEVLLWQLLRNRQLGGVKFRRQQPVGKFILDFYAYEFKLAIELDGGDHAKPSQARYDAGRTLALEAEGIRVLRFWNNELLSNPEAVLQRIWDALNDDPHPQTPPSKKDATSPLSPRIDSPLFRRERGRG